MEYDVVSKVIVTQDKAKEWIPQECLNQISLRRMRRFAAEGRVFQIDMDSGEEDSTADFLSRSIRMAYFMRDSGIKEGDVVSTCTNIHLNMYVPVFAARLIGALIASTDVSQTFKETKHLIKLVQPKMYFVAKGSLEMIAKCIETLNIECQIITFEPVANFVDFSLIMAQYKDADELSFAPALADYTQNRKASVIFFTSGTTGLPKAPLITHNLCKLAAPWLEKTGRILGALTPYWISSTSILAYGHLSGMTICLTNNVDSKIWDTIRKHSISVVILAFTKIAVALQYLNEPVDCLKEMILMGGQLPSDLTQQLKEKLPDCNVKNYYGTTETGFVTFYQNCTKAKSLGTPILNGQSIKVVSIDTDNAVGFNETGEIRVKSEYQFLEYCGQDSLDCWDSEGFYKTGDLGYYDENFEIFVVDRIKDIFKYKNWHVSPIIIENALCSHEDVVLAVAFGVPHPLDGNHTMAAVVLTESAKVTEEELLQFANGKLDDLEQIRAGIKIVPINLIPFTSTGKIKKYVLKKLLLSDI